MATYEIEIRRYSGTEHKVLKVIRFSDWTEARLAMRSYNENRLNGRTEAVGPWPIS